MSSARSDRPAAAWSRARTECLYIADYPGTNHQDSGCLDHRNRDRATAGLMQWFSPEPGSTRRRSLSSNARSRGLFS